MYTVAIDGSNIRSGGGITHLVECLRAYTPDPATVKRVIVYGGPEILDLAPREKWIELRTAGLLLGNSLKRTWWRHSQLSGELKQNADILLVLGGAYLGAFRPYVALAQNLLPFDRKARALEGFSIKGLRLAALRIIQAATFRNANGVIFMSEISRQHILHSMKYPSFPNTVIHHGTAPRFIRRETTPQPNVIYSGSKPFRLLYVSVLERYKHQAAVISAVIKLRAEGIPVILDLVGYASLAQAREMQQFIQKNSCESAIRLLGPRCYEDINEIYSQADAFVFASSCETFGIILLEAMAAGLPIACSHRTAMPEVVGGAALQFEPTSLDSISNAVRKLFSDSQLRRTLSYRAKERAKQFSWKVAAHKMFDFVIEIAKRTTRPSKKLHT